MEMTERKTLPSLFHKFDATQREEETARESRNNKGEKEFSKLATSKEQETFSYFFEGYITHRFEEMHRHIWRLKDRKK